MGRNLTDGEREIQQEAERDARETEEGLRDDLLEIADEMTEIKMQIKELAERAYDLIPEGRGRQAAYGYWYAHILGALDEDSPFLGGSMMTMQDTIDGMTADDE